MKYIDMHCDTLLCCAEDLDKHELLSNQFSVDFTKMKKAGALGQFFAIFMTNSEKIKMLPFMSPYRTNTPEERDDEFIRLTADFFHEQLDINSNIAAFAGNYGDIEINEKNGKMSVMLSLEDGRAVNGSLKKLNNFYDMGIRLMNLTWNHPNCFGWPNSDDLEIMSRGLTDFGIESVEYMNELGMMIDVSHISDGGFYDIARISKKPFVASHSNSRVLSQHRRNLTDDMIKTLADEGGMTGVNFNPAFLNTDINDRHSAVSRIVDHIVHISNIGGIEAVGLGSDLDGISGELEISEPSKFGLIFDEMERRGFSGAQIEKFAYGNFLRVFRDTVR